MFTIKVIKKKAENCAVNMVSLYEGCSPKYEYVHHKSEEDFKKHIKKFCISETIQLENRLDEWGDKTVEKQTLVLSFYKGESDVFYILLIDSTEIYIMHNGQTVDKVYC